MSTKAFLATAVVGGALLAAAVPAAAGEDDRPGGRLCAAPWQWNGPLSLLHEGPVPGYVTCADDRATGGGTVSVLDDACAVPWRWNGPLEIFTVDSPARLACDGDPAG
ncbi:hypothetical protein [Nocardia sp. NRRL S-836]|uniref:hypothetical protein n=1 Tax=Nocardia sp. NRRL S-836 TaxID=1519492 RepID=UPI0006ADD074|nr:hypothetical protein [Nocardia sp. NRRL S-836]KOV80623.1 hypothetical protein ADL03_32180 [Nocardia sp. NRRL S-836]